MVGRVLLDRYRVVRFLAEGGMSRIYLAQQLDQDRQVAVKVMNTTQLGETRWRDILRREAQLMGRFRHPNSVALYDTLLEEAEQPCLIMEYVPGISLGDLLERHGRLSPRRVGLLLGQLCSVLQAAHQQGLVHRDLKPGNIMVTDADTPNERIKLLDLGLAKLDANAGNGPYFALADFEGAGPPVSGTPEYLCPEAIRRLPIDHRGDLYSVGIMLFEMLTGKRPFDRPTIKETLRAQLHAAPPTFAEGAVDDVPFGIQEVVLACIEKDPVDRPQSARELALYYEQALGEPIGLIEAPLSEELPSETVPEVQLVAPVDPHALTYHMAAWMPEQIAVMKLRACLPDIGGEVVSSAPGQLGIRLSRQVTASRQKSGFFGSFFRSCKPVLETTDMDLTMTHADPSQRNQLSLTVVLHPPEGDKEGGAVEWKRYAEKIIRNLAAYLMAKM